MKLISLIIDYTCSKRPCTSSFTLSESECTSTYSPLPLNV